MTRFAEIIVNSLHEAVAVLDKDLRILAVNQPFCRLFDCSSSEVVDQEMHEVVSGWGETAVFFDLVQQETPSGILLDALVADQDCGEQGRRSILVDVQRIEDSGHILVIIEDVTARRRADDELRAMAVRLTMARHRERQRIAALLHDDVQQHLYAIGLRTTALKADLQAGKAESARRLVDEIEESVAISRQTIRNLASDLSPPVLEDETLSDALMWLVDRTERQYGLVVDLQMEGPLPQVVTELRVLLYRCVRELLFNVVKHADTSSAAVVLRPNKGDLEIVVRDEGVGFDEEAAAAARRQGSLGLFAMRQELNPFGGSVSVSSAAGSGTTVTLRVPHQCAIT